MLRKICMERTELRQADIVQLERLAHQLPIFSEIMGADLFIDCMLSEEKAVVVAQARPAGLASIYEKNVVGQYALIENEPAVFHCAKNHTPVRDIKAVTQENHVVSQNVVPIFNESKEVIAVLIQETDISRTLQQERKWEVLSKSYEEQAPSLRSERPDAFEVNTLREAHHRVKNSLQLVASNLNMQARKYKGTPAEAVLVENVGRVLSIATVHDMLTKTQSLTDQVSLTALLKQICTGLWLLIPAGKDIAILVQGDEVTLSGTQASSAAQVVNELITNALEHAFSGKDSGEIQISVNAGTLFHTVTIWDNGIGFPSNSSQENRFGLRIVEATIRNKLLGKLHIHSDETGTQISFDIKNEAVPDSNT